MLSKAKSEGDLQPNDARFEACGGHGWNRMPGNLSKKPEVCPSNSHKRESCPLLVQDNTQERSIDLKAAVVLDESQLPEFVHEEVNPWACCADHLRQRFLRHFGEHSVRLVFLAVAGQQ
jgi:hypothetical protein